MTSKIKINSVCKFLNHMENKLKDKKPSDCFPGLSFTCEIFFSHAWLSERECFLSLHIPLEETGAGSDHESVSEESIPSGSFLLHCIPASSRRVSIVTSGFGCSVVQLSEHNIRAVSHSTKYYLRFKKKWVIDSWRYVFTRRAFPSPLSLNSEEGLQNACPIWTNTGTNWLAK